VVEFRLAALAADLFVADDGQGEHPPPGADAANEQVLDQHQHPAGRTAARAVSHAAWR